MNIAFLGISTDDKRFFMLCLARIMAHQKKVVICSAKNYIFEEEIEQVYDYCGIEISHLAEGETVLISSEEEGYCFLDIERLTPLQEGFKAVAVCEPSRGNLELSIRLAGEYSWAHPSLELTVIYLNLMEYCKVSKKYLDLFWERSVPSFTKISEVFSIYFEEANRVVMLESQFSDRFPLRALSTSFKASLVGLIQSFFGLDIKQARNLLKMAERMK